MSRPLSLGLYGAATALLEPVAPMVLARRVRAGKEDSARVGERLGRAMAPRPAGPLVWLHGASVGETISLLPLVGRLRARRPDLVLLVTSGTTTSAELLGRRLPPGVIHQYAPIDAPGAVRRFLDHWRPGLAVFAESELWPNLIFAARERGVRLALVSARITEKSARGWSRAPIAGRALFQAFDLILPQDRDSALRIEALGGTAGPMLNMKFAAEALPCDEAELVRMRGQIGLRRVVLAASTHPGEDELISSAVTMMPDPTHPPLLVLAPRHPDRGGAIAQSFRERSMHVAQRSSAEPVTAETYVYVADTLGEMGLFFRLADVAVMGGSFFTGVGGHNPLEPARLGVPVITGPDIGNFREVYGEMFGQGALLAEGEGEAELSGHLADLLGDLVAARRLGELAQTYAVGEGERLEAALETLETLLPA